MPRIKRCLVEGLVHHIINRGNGKQKIFHKNQDYRVFVKLMRDAKKRYPINIFAYCLMPNHFHLVLMPCRPNYLSRWIQWLLTTHARRYHYYYKTSGHIWQDRFKSFIIQNDEHLITVLQYVEGNPVRAGLVPSARDWPWSSHLERLGNNHGKILDNLPFKLPSDWTRYIDEPLSTRELKKLRKSTNRQAPYGSDEWQKKISQQLGIAHTLRPRGRPRKEMRKK